MRRLISITLLAASVLLAASAQARGGATRGGGARTVQSHGTAGHSSAENSRARDLRSNRFGNNNLGNNSLLYPAWYDEPYDGEEAGPPEESGPPLMPAMMVQGGKQRPAAWRIPAGPKMTELPGATAAAAAAPLPPAMFILTSGERIEARQYLVTYDRVQLTVDRQPRTIPLSMLDVNATLAADRQRGIDLRIPSGQNEVSLGF